MDVEPSGIPTTFNTQTTQWLASSSTTGSPEQQTQSARRNNNTRQDEQQQAERREQRARKKRSANQVRSRPADPAVISSILDSFDALSITPGVHSNEYYPDTGSLSSSKRSRPRSSGSTSVPPSIARTPASSGFGMEYGASPMADYFAPADAAPPPSIRTSRAPSGLSHYAAPSPRQSFTDLHASALRHANGLNSRTGSYTSLRERDPSNRNKHSAESWIKTPEPRRKSLRRINSQESLRQSAGEVFDVPIPTGGANLSILARADQVFTFKTPPRTNEKSRLYLVDTGGSEEHAIDDALMSEASPMASSDGTMHTEDGSPRKQRTSPLKNPITDSIPMRTSSLRISSNSRASSKKRDKVMKRMTAPALDTEEETASKSPIPESSWADLGEDDETVKRIRELRERRKTFIAESSTPSIFEDPPPLPVLLPSIPKQDFNIAHDTLPYRVEQRTVALNSRPPAARAITEPPIKAHKILGITTDLPRPTSSGTATQSISPVANRRTQAVIDDLPTQVRNGTKGPESVSLPTPPLSLDYSYAQAVDALSGAHREMDQPRHKRHGSMRATPQYTTISSPISETDSQDSPLRIRTKSARKRTDPAARWTHHPDLPTDLSERRKSRRKSMSDARRLHHGEESMPNLERQDSIELAVQDFLEAPRLSRTVRHPRSGRIIKFSEVGDPKGAAVFICVGMGLTRYVTAFYDELATTLRLRLITIDRPGVGGSEPYPLNDRSGPLSWPDDVVAICQHLGITSFSLLAHSAGAIYALATALILPHLINGKVHLLAPWIPPSQLEATPHATTEAPPAGALPRSQRLLRVLPTSFLKAANSSFMTATSASLKPASKRQLQAARDRAREQSLSPTRVTERPGTANRPDYHRRESLMLMDQFMPTINPLENFPIPIAEEAGVLDLGEGRRGSLFLGATATPTDPSFEFAQAGLNAAEHAERERQVEYTSRLTLRTWERATRDSNPATDLLVCLERNREIGFKYTDVSRQVVITHGSEDKRVPLANVKWLSGQMNARAVSGGWNSFGSTEQIPQSREGWYDARSSRGGCELRVLEREEHGLMASAPIMSDVLTEIAGYWAGEKKGMMM
ncbi:hypothetical protein LTR86_005775 [Recurvomyces mirabilis]|nr:hypothetical protein LTR86_005775 [Recurvomyces mirabilis]